MEFYKPTRNDLKESVSAAKKVSALTGSCFIYHWFDCLYCIIRYGCSPLQYYEGGFFKLRSFDRRDAYTRERIGKDVAITNDGPILIEGKQSPGVIFDSLNMNHGLYKEMMSYK